MGNYFLSYFFLFALTSFTNSTPYILFICLYNEKHNERQEEYLECLTKNLRHQLIKKIHILYDTSKNTNLKTFLPKIIDTAIQIGMLAKLEITSIDHRQTYGDIFKVANQCYPNQQIILANADIYFNETLKLLDDINLNNKIITLTRWEPDKNGTLSPLKHKTNGAPIWGSQDVWIFTTPIRQFSGWEIPLGLQMCDHKIAFQLLQAGLDVVNPCLDVQAIHVHTSEIRNWYHDKTRSLAYSAFIPWCKTEDIKKRPSDHWVMS